MAKLGLVTLELMLAELRRPAFAGDVPVKMEPAVAQYEAVAGGEQYIGDYTSGAGPDEEDDGCGCGGDGCGDGGCCGGGCGGGDGCSHETTMGVGPEIGSEAMGPMASPPDFCFRAPLRADPVGDRDKTRDRSPRPDRKRLPWSFAPGAEIAS
ncbi:MAG: hypothetical protein PHW55_02805 [Methanothrix sp.]|jgi:hypothetical protein|nr:hypothetical protein [Methanothrix sp.]